MKGAVDCFVRHGGKEADLTLVRVPGANELPQVAQRLAATGKVDAVVTLGAVIQGATPHADLINGTVARSLAKIALDTGVPVLNGIVCALNLEQAIERAGTKQGNKGWDAVAPRSRHQRASFVRRIYGDTQTRTRVGVADAVSGGYESGLDIEKSIPKFRQQYTRGRRGRRS